MLSPGPERHFPQSCMASFMPLGPCVAFSGRLSLATWYTIEPPCLHPNILFPYCFPLCFSKHWSPSAFCFHNQLYTSPQGWWFCFSITCPAPRRASIQLALSHSILWTNKWIDKWTPLAQRAQNIDINCVSRRPSTCHFLTAAKIEINLFQYSGLITHRKWKLSVIKVTSPQRSNVGSSKLFALYISIPGSGWSPGGGHGNQLQYSCLENSMDRGAWWARVHGITKSWRWLKWLSMHIHIQNTSLSKCSTQSYMLFSLLTMELEHISTIYLTNPLLMM